MAERGQLKKGTVTSKSKTSSIRRIERRKGERRGVEVRDVNSERGGIPTAPSGAMSSFEAMFYHDVPPEVWKRLTKRYTGGHRKYGVGHVNINWRVGLNDPKYIADRFNHAMQHIVDFLEDQNDKDDNLGGAIWNLAFLIVAETRCPKAFKEAFVQAKLFGKTAKDLHEKMKKELGNVRS